MLRNAADENFNNDILLEWCQPLFRMPPRCPPQAPLILPEFGSSWPGGQPMAYTPAVEVAWDEGKKISTQRRHGVSFEEAAEFLSSGVDYLEIFDEAHSDTEDRFIAVGPIRRGLVVIVWTERDEEVVRIISARWATRRERALYVSYLEPKP